MEAREHISKQIKYFRTKKLKINAQELAEQLVPPRSSKTISSWETERTQPDSEALIQLCKIFDEPISAFYPEEFSQYGSMVSTEAYADIPLYGSIAAGSPLPVIPVDNTHPIPIEMYAKYPQAFLLKVDGDSMSNVLPNGSYALIDPTQTDPRNNGAYALWINGSDATIKRVKRLANGYELIPDSKDPTFKSIIFDYTQEEPSEIVIIGRVVWMMLPFTWEF